MSSFIYFLAIFTLFHFFQSTFAAQTINVLTYNVAGLPQAVNNNGEGDKQANSLEIGRRFASSNFDVIHMQEDFNYHAYIYRTDTHKFRTATSGGALIGSGLNTVSNYDFSNFQRTKWRKCYVNEADCLTPKGFTSMTITFDNSKQVDFYNLHADADDEQGDEDARVDNFAQVASAIAANSQGKAVIVMGDTNCRYTRSLDKLTDFLDATSLIDPWVTLYHSGTPPARGSDALLCSDPIPSGNTCETVDKIFYRSGTDVTLTAVSWSYDANEFLNKTSGEGLSDHIPVKATFQIA